MFRSKRRKSIGHSGSDAQNRRTRNIDSPIQHLAGEESYLGTVCLREPYPEVIPIASLASSQHRLCAESDFPDSFNVILCNEHDPAMPRRWHEYDEALATNTLHHYFGYRLKR